MVLKVLWYLKQTIKTSTREALLQILCGPQAKGWIYFVADLQRLNYASVKQYENIYSPGDRGLFEIPDLVTLFLSYEET